MATPIGVRLKMRRVEMGFTQQELAKATGMTQGALSLIERGGSKSAAADNLLRIAAVLETNPAWLLTGKGDKELSSFHPSDNDITDIANKLTPELKAAWISVGLALLKPDT